MLFLLPSELRFLKHLKERKVPLLSFFFPLVDSPFHFLALLSSLALLHRPSSLYLICRFLLKSTNSQRAKSFKCKHSWKSSCPPSITSINLPKMPIAPISWPMPVILFVRVRLLLVSPLFFFIHSQCMMSMLLIFKRSPAASASTYRQKSTSVRPHPSFSSLLLRTPIFRSIPHLSSSPLSLSSFPLLIFVEVKTSSTGTRDRPMDSNYGKKKGFSGRGGSFSAANPYGKKGVGDKRQFQH